MIDRFHLCPARTDGTPSASSLRPGVHFAQLADLTARRLRELGGELRHRLPYRLDAVNALETVITLYALPGTAHPALLLPPHLTPPERAEVLAAATRAGEVSHEDAAAIIFTSGRPASSRGAVLTRSAFLGVRCGGRCQTSARGRRLLVAVLCPSRALGAFRFSRDVLPRGAAWLWPGVRCRAISGLDCATARDAGFAGSDHAEPNPGRAPGLATAAASAPILLGGAAASPKLLGRAKERYLPIVLTYGLTETCSQVAATPYARVSTRLLGNGMPHRGSTCASTIVASRSGDRRCMAGY